MNPIAVKIIKMLVAGLAARRKLRRALNGLQRNKTRIEAFIAVRDKITAASDENRRQRRAGEEPRVNVLMTPEEVLAVDNVLDSMAKALRKLKRLV